MAACSQFSAATLPGVSTLFGSSVPPNAESTVRNAVIAPSYLSASNAMPSLSDLSAFIAASASLTTCAGLVGGVLIRSVR